MDPINVQAQLCGVINLNAANKVGISSFTSVSYMINLIQN